MNILSCNYNHDGAVAIISDGILRAYVNTERLSRIKKHPGVTKEAFDEVLRIVKISPQEIDYIILNNLNYMFAPDYIARRGGYEQDSWENILIEIDEDEGSDYGDKASSSSKEIRKNNKVFCNTKDFGVVFEQNDIWPKIRNNKLSFETHAFFRGFRRPCLINPPHYLLHASNVYYSSPFRSSMVFVWDPTGFEAFIGKDNKLYPIFNDKSLNMINLGAVYAEISKDILSEGSLTSAGKMMGLAPYGRHQINKEVLDRARFLGANYNNLYSFLDTESNSLPIYYKEQSRQLNAKKAFLTQTLFENQLIYVFKLLYQYAKTHNVEPNICLSGGSSLNCIANEKAFSSSKFKNIFLHPACGDDGTAIGGGMYLWHQILGNQKAHSYSNKELMYSLREYTEEDIKKSLESFKDNLIIKKDYEYIETTVELLIKGKIVAWFEGGSEIGPRALGHRSIIADPRSNTVKDFINSEIKQRESFRPFAPSILREHCKEWFNIENSPFMLRAAPVLKNILPGISHVDNSSRPQTVTSEDNLNYYNLILSFYKRTNIPAILNTSFNIKGEPIVETPSDAIKSFMNSKIDVLVFPNFVITRK